jgi:CheY-like chemotaxis protein
MARLTQHLARARDRAEEANRAKSRFLAGMSHELRTPLNGILGYAHLLHLEGGLTAAQTIRLDAMLAAGHHLLEMITCILDLSEIEAGQVHVKAVAFDLKAVVAACIDLVRPMAEAKNLALTLVTQPDIPQDVVADPTRLRQILLNLLGNAAKFTSQGTISVNLRMLADRSVLRIEVVDTGRGIAAGQHERLFQYFERLDIEANDRIEGAGLGLALSARLAALMGARLGHEDNPNGGSVFWLDLPLGNAAMLAKAPSEIAIGTPAMAPQALLVLVVDDVAMNRDIASSFLRASGHTVVCVNSGRDAIAAAASANFDVVLMDVRMPEMDGLEASRRIRALGGVRGQVPIVALTAQAFTDQIAKCRAAGMDRHLAKPFEPDTLLYVVMSAAAGGRILAKPSDPEAVLQAELSPLVVGADLPVLHRIAFQRTAAFLDPAAIKRYLDTISSGCHGLLRVLNETGAQARATDEHADSAHALAGPAGLFGFQRLASLCLMFERTADPEQGIMDERAIAQGLRAAIEASLLAIQAVEPMATAFSRVDPAVRLAANPMPSSRTAP